MTVKQRNNTARDTSSFNWLQLNLRVAYCLDRTTGVLARIVEWRIYAERGADKSFTDRSRVDKSPKRQKPQRHRLGYLLSLGGFVHGASVCRAFVRHSLGTCNWSKYWLRSNEGEMTSIVRVLHSFYFRSGYWICY